MSVNLELDSKPGASPQPVKGAGTASSLFLTDLQTGAVHLKPEGKLVFGFTEGEWIQNSAVNKKDHGIAFYGTYAERARLTNDGKFGIGTMSPSANLHVKGSVRLEGLPAGGGTALVVDNDGNIRKQGSSARFKENVQELRDDFNKLMSLEPVSFTYKETGDGSVGYIAEDLHERGLGNLVSYDSEGQPFSVHYALLPVYLLEILKEQQSAIQSLQEQLGQLLKSDR